jgi:purine-binding chemotaxis protein CheW
MSDAQDMSATVRKILRERARLLATPADGRDEGVHLEVLAFQVAGEIYAVEMGNVREVVPLRGLTPVPCTPSFVLGVVNVRGELCTVMDLKRIFGMPECGLANATTVVVIRDERLEFGIAADVVLDVRQVAVADLAPPPATLSGVNADFVRGVSRDGVIVVDAARVLGHPSMIVREQVQ